MASSPALRLPEPVVRWLAAKSPVERRLVAGLTVLVLVAVPWVLLWQPLVRDIDAMRAARPGGQAALATARRMVDEMSGLARTPASPAPDPRASLERVLAQHNLRAAVTQTEWSDERVRVVFAAVGYDALVAALETLQREGRLRAVEATLTARVEPGLVRAELTLAR